MATLSWESAKPCRTVSGVRVLVLYPFWLRTKQKRAPPPNPRARHRPKVAAPCSCLVTAGVDKWSKFRRREPFGGRRTDPVRTKGCDGTGPPAAARSPSGDARTALRCPSLGRRHASGDRLWQFGNACELMFCCA